jgi:predicted DNA binding protein
MEELGAELGISQQTVASRLRRGTKQFLGSTIPETEGQNRQMI